MTQLAKLLEGFERRWPLQGAEAWDRSGLLIGDQARIIHKVLLTVDITSPVIDEAITGGFDLVISHHPVLLREVDSIIESSSKQALLTKAASHNVALYAAHTNADITENGVSASLANLLGIQNQRPLIAVTETTGHGRIGVLAEPVSLLEFARTVATKLAPTAGGLRVAGEHSQLLSKVALCGGAGDSFIGDAYSQGADVYVTSDLRHHPVQEALELATAEGRAFALIDISHWAAELVWLEAARAELASEFSQVTFEVSDLRTDPWEFSVTQ